MRERTNGKGADYVFETSGSQPGWTLSLEAVRHGGRVVPVGLPYVNRSVDFGKVFDKEIDVYSVNMHQTGDYSEAVHLINRGELNADFRKVITSVWPLEQTKDALLASKDKDGNDIKILLAPGLKEKIDLTK
jgi:L-iditol 2-dehydrogenase